MFFKKKEYIAALLMQLLKFINPGKSITTWLKGQRAYPRFFKDLVKYKKLPKAESISILDIQPQLFDNTSSTPFDAHYLYQDIWAFKKILKARPDSHVDVGSLTNFVAMISTITNVTFVDVRPTKLSLDNFKSKYGSILNMPYTDNSIDSLSCLHVAEHIGLGRYGEPLDSKGTVNGIRELSRILAVGGNLYFSVPVGRPRVCFNAHRIHSPQQIIKYFEDLKIIEFSGVNDQGRYLHNIAPEHLQNERYGCGYFHFIKGIE